MTSGMSTLIYPVTDIAASREVFTSLLGVAPSMDEPYYVGFDLEGQHVGLDPNGHSKGMTGPVGYWHVEDIEGALSDLVTAGAVGQQPVTDVGGGKLIATVKDLDGNLLGLLQPPTAAS